MALMSHVGSIDGAEAEDGAGAGFVVITRVETSLQPGAVARPCNPATWRQVLLDGLKVGDLVTVGSC